MKTRRQWLTDATGRLTAAGASDAALDAQWMLAHVLGAQRLLLLTAPDAPLAAADEAALDALLARRETGEPLQYVLGEAPFMGHPFAVTPDVLIPRADTEALADAAIRRLSGGGRALELGTGSGAVAVSVALACPACRMTAVDISPAALAVAEQNARSFGARVRFVHSDLYAALGGEAFDVILSNPPYIRTGDLAHLQPEVRREPRMALDGGADGLAFYRRIVRGLAPHLAPGGALLVECGDGQAEAVREMLAGHFEKIETRTDWAGLQRVVTGDGYAG